MKIKAAIAGLAFASVSLFPLGQSLAAQASTPPVQTNVNGRPVAYHDSLSPAGLHKTDAELGFATHWEGIVDVSTPNSPISWTRMPDAGQSTPSTTGNSISWTRIGDHGIASHLMAMPQDPNCDLNNNSCADTCTNLGGIRLWQHADESGDCIKYTKSNPNISAYANFSGVQYPYSTNYVRYSESFSTYGSNGSGTLHCGGGDWGFISNTNYGNLYNASSGKCNGSVGNLNSMNYN